MAYDKADNTTSDKPIIFKDLPDPFSFSKLMPQKARAMAIIVISDNFSRNTTALITATMIGYKKRIVEAMPASI